MNERQKDLLRKYLDGACSGRELEEVAKLFKLPEANDVFDSLLVEKHGSEWDRKFPERPENLEQWRRTVFQRITSEAQQTGAGRSSQLPLFLRYAAVWAGLLMVSVFLIWQLNDQQQLTYLEKVNPSGSPLLFTLPDSSHIYLAAGSKIRYPENFNDELREVTLEGEAFFDVERNPSKPFVINTDNIQTRVLGTSFKIEAFEGQSVIVSVATGKVGVSHHSDKNIETLALLTPGQKITWDRKTLKATQGQVDVYGLEQWTAGSMVFDEKTMLQVAGELQRRYGITLEFVDREVALNKVRTRFPGKKPLSEIMQVLAAVGAFSYETSDNKTYKIYKTE